MGVNEHKGTVTPTEYTTEEILMSNGPNGHIPSDHRPLFGGWVYCKHTAPKSKPSRLRQATMVARKPEYLQLELGWAHKYGGTDNKEGLQQRYFKYYGAEKVIRYYEDKNCLNQKGTDIRLPEAPTARHAINEKGFPILVIPCVAAQKKWWETNTRTEYHLFFSNDPKSEVQDTNKQEFC